MYSKLWTRSEDSFLHHFCEKIPKKEVTFYLWKNGTQWPKFTFIRLNDTSMSVERFNSLCQDFVGYSNIHKNELYIKINDQYKVDNDIANRINKSNSRLAYLKFNQNSKTFSERSQLIECSNMKDLEEFWKINSSGRARENPFESPLWPIIQQSFSSGTKYFNLEYEGQFISAGAIDQLKDGWNLWGLATIKEFQNRGFMSACIMQIMKKYSGDYYAQVNYGELTHKYFNKYCNADQIASETWYTLK